jgi:hypothetical protein
MYIVRTENGTMVCKISNLLANQLMNNLSGQFKPSTINPKKVLFIIAEDSTMKIDGGTITLYLWAGYYLVAE